jgi:hypothetical protein
MNAAGWLLMTATPNHVIRRDCTPLEWRILARATKDGDAPNAQSRILRFLRSSVTCGLHGAQARVVRDYLE